MPRPRERVPSGHGMGGRRPSLSAVRPREHPLTQLRDRQEPRAGVQKYGAPRALYDQLALNYSLEFILIDLGPSLDAWNTTNFLSSHYILPPAFPDFFSAASVLGLLDSAVPEMLAWRETHLGVVAKAKEKNRRVGDKYDDFGEKPLILPFLVHSYKMCKHESSMIELSDENFILSMGHLVANPLLDGEQVGSGRGVRKEVRDMFYFTPTVKDMQFSMVVPFCRKLEQAYSWGHKTGVPVINLKPEKVTALLSQHHGDR
eukprot:3933743-Rhodomonas_salina.1